MNTKSSPRTYHVDNTFLDSTKKPENTEVLVIYLNRPFDFETILKLHSMSTYSVIADGAANYFYQMYQELPERYLTSFSV